MGSPCSSTGIHLLQCGVLHGLEVDLCFPVFLHGPQGHSCLTMHLGLQENLRSSAFSLTLVCAELFTLRILTHLFWLLLYSNFSTLFLKCVIPKPLSLMGPPSYHHCHSILEPLGIGSMGDIKEASGSFPKKTPLKPACY